MASELEVYSKSQGARVLTSFVIIALLLSPSCQNYSHIQRRLHVRVVLTIPDALSDVDGRLSQMGVRHHPRF